MGTDGLEQELELPEFTVTNRRSLPEGGILYSVEAAARPVCPHCHSSELSAHEKSVTLYNDLPKFGHRIVLQVTKRRYICRECGTTTGDNFKALADGNMTSRLRDYIKAETLYYPAAVISQKYGLSNTAVSRLLAEKVQSYDGSYFPSTPAGICLDAMQANYGPVTLLIDIANKQGQVIEMACGQNQLAIRKKLQYFFHPKSCRLAVVDLNDNFLSALTAVVPDAVVITDRIFINRMFLNNYRLLREEISGSIKTPKDRTYRNRANLLDPPASTLGMKKREELKSLLQHYPEFRASYEAKEEFLRIEELADRNEATRAYSTWRTTCIDNTIGFNDFIGIIENWKDIILKSYEYRDKNYANCIRKGEATVEEIDRQGSHYSFESLRGKVVLRNQETKPTSMLYDLKQLQTML